MGGGGEEAFRARRGPAAWEHFFQSPRGANSQWTSELRAPSTKMRHLSRRLVGSQLEASANPPHPWTQPSLPRVLVPELVPELECRSPPFVSCLLLGKLLNPSGPEFSLSLKWMEIPPP